MKLEARDIIEAIKAATPEELLEIWALLGAGASHPVFYSTHPWHIGPVECGPPQVSNPPPVPDFPPLRPPAEPLGKPSWTTGL